MAERVCSCCKVSKPFTNEFYYIEGRHAAKCRACKNIKIGDRNTVDFMENLTDDWGNHPDYDIFYFERNSSRIFNTETGKYLANIRSFNNKTKKSPKDIKWIIFNGSIPENQIVKTKKDHNINSLDLDSLECVYIHCETCNVLIENPNILTRYCSHRCQLGAKNVKAKEYRKNSIKTYVSEKFYMQKNINKEKHFIEIDYDVNYLLSLGKKCFYCDIECTFGNDIQKPDALTFDRKDSELGYYKENIVQCCWFCNVSKNITLYDDWTHYIEFIQDPNMKVLDLSQKDYSLNASAIDISSIYSSLKRSSPVYYPESKSAKRVFLDLVKKQEFKDSIFNFFPIIYLERNCLFNASIDAIDSSLPNLEKHRPDNLQIIPKCFNYAKQCLTQEEFLKEWVKRGFKTDFSDCTIKLPEDYIQDCYFHKMITQ